MSNVKCFYLEATGESKQEDNYTTPLYRRIDTGEILTWRDAPVGAIARALWLEEPEPRWVQGMTGRDGKAYVVKTPGGDWYIDSRAGNCDSPCKNCGQPYVNHTKEGNQCYDYVDAKPHTCWCRNGEPPVLTVGKNCVTCSAGGGSILFSDSNGRPTYHGFLQNGYLTNC